jgi:putative phage-type endonuclease
VHNTTRSDQSPTFHQERRGGIGSSDAAIIAGLSNFKKTAMMLWQEKISGRAAFDLSSNPRVKWGILHEPTVAAEFQQEHPDFKVRRYRKAIRSKKHPFAIAHIDRFVKDSAGARVPFEIKTSAEWDDWHDGVPHYYMPQVQHQLLVTEAPYAFVAVLLGGYDYREYVVERNDLYIEALVELEAEFWQHVIDRTPPKPQTYHDVCMRFPQVKADSQFLADEDMMEVAIELARVNSQRLALEAQEDKLRATIGLAMGEARTLIDNKGTALLNFNGIEKAGFDLKALQLDEPELAGRYARKIHYREIRLLKGLKAAA